MSWGDDSETVTTSNEPWGPQADALRQVLQRAGLLYGANPDLSVGMSPQTQEGLAATQNTARNIIRHGGVAQPGNPTFSRIAQNENAYDQFLRSTARGDYLGANPHLDQMWGTAADRIGEAFNEIITPEIDTTFAMAGARGGSQGKSEAFGRAGRELSRSLSDTAGQIYGGAYESERGRMTSAASAGGALANQTRAQQMQAAGALNEAEAQRIASQMQAAAALAGVGQAREGQAAYEMSGPWAALMQYANAIGGNYGGTSSTVSPLYSSPASAILGGALGGARLGSSIDDSGWGAGIGAAAGGLLSLLG